MASKHTPDNSLPGDAVLIQRATDLASDIAKIWNADPSDPRMEEAVDAIVAEFSGAPEVSRALIDKAVKSAFAEVGLQPDADCEYAEGIRAVPRQFAFIAPPDTKKFYYVSFTFMENGDHYFDTVRITDAEAQKIRQWLAKREAADLIAKPEVNSLTDLTGFDGIMENLRENDMLELDGDEEDENVVSSVERLTDLAERHDAAHGTPEQEDGESGCEGCEGPGFWSETCPVPGVLARVENNTAVRSKVHRCDNCERFDSDEKAVKALADFGVQITD